MIKTSKIRIKLYKKKPKPTSRAKYCEFELENLTGDIILLNTKDCIDSVEHSYVGLISNGHWKKYIKEYYSEYWHSLE